MVSAQPSLKVKVPEGWEPGSIIHVKVPNEDRIIAVVPPNGVSEFHVSYGLAELDSGEAMSHLSPADSASKMILVKVPPEVSPGSKIHVKVPGEDKTIEATVPYGVKEFHVSYPLT